MDEGLTNSIIHKSPHLRTIISIFEMKYILGPILKQVNCHTVWVSGLIEGRTSCSGSVMGVC